MDSKYSEILEHAENKNIVNAVVAKRQPRSTMLDSDNIMVRITAMTFTVNTPRFRIDL